MDCTQGQPHFESWLTILACAQDAMMLFLLLANVQSKLNSFMHLTVMKALHSCSYCSSLQGLGHDSVFYMNEKNIQSSNIESKRMDFNT